MKAAGKFISIEGGDGAGKSTQLEVISQSLSDNNIGHIMSREPGGTALGEMLRDILLNKQKIEISDDAELLLMFAARAQHVNSVIEPALRQGKWVISDRFVDASFAYQGARGVTKARIESLSNWTLEGLMPDLTLWFDLPVKQGLQRVKSRGEQDRFEIKSMDYKQRVQAIYHARAEDDAQRIKRIDASGDINAVSAQVKHHIQAYIKQCTQ